MFCVLQAPAKFDFYELHNREIMHLVICLPKLTCGACGPVHEYTDLKAFVVVNTKEGLAGRARQSFFRYETDYKISLYCLNRLYSVVGVIPKDLKVCFLVTRVR